MTGTARVVALDSVPVDVMVNGGRQHVVVRPELTLAHLLREELLLTGTKVSCDVQVCGACTVLLDGRAVSACSVLAVDADGRAVETIESLAAADGTLHALQQAFVECSAFQCGFCTPGMIMTLLDLQRRNPKATRSEIVDQLDGSICRCTGYLPIIEAAELAFERMQHG